MRYLFALIAVIVLSAPVFAQQDAADTQGRHADLEQLGAELLARHPNPFANIDRSDWESAVSDLDGKLDGMTPNQFGVALQRLVALLGDANTSVNPQRDTALSKRRYPVELYLFEDGLYVRRAAPEFGDIVGGKVVLIGKADPGDAIRAVAETISHENTWWIRALAPERLVIPEVLDGLGLVDDLEHLPLTVEKEGGTTTATLSPVAVVGLGDDRRGAAIDESDWIDMDTAAEPPQWRRHPGELMWHAWLDEQNALYVCYRAVTSPNDGLSNAEFWNEVFGEVDRRHPEYFVIDIRENSEGNRMLNRNVIQQIMRRPEIDRSDRFFVIIGRRTFSAAQQFASQLDWWTQATFVGEPTGQRVSQYGDSKPVVLDNSGISVNISTLFHQAPDALDNRDFIPPDIYAPLKSGDYRNGTDPALDAVFTARDREPVMARVLGALQAGQVDRAQRLLANSKMDPANRYRSFESDMNAVGYDLMAHGRIDAAVSIFRINTQVYPGSANAFDSLGEALEKAGRREEAIAAYRKAL
ncbi:MAG: hypothetical protein WBW88_07380, partial [Rhodothermales bacterium]